MSDRTARLRSLRQEPRGFTVIELLVVVSIIALLVALLLPSMRKAKETALRVKCVARIRQMSAALVTYTADHDSYFPAFPEPLAGGVNHVRHQYGTWIPPMLPYMGLKAPIHPSTGQPLTASQVTGYYPITSLLRTEYFQSMHCPSVVYGGWATGSTTPTGYSHVFYTIQNNLRRHYDKEPLYGPYIPWKLVEMQGRVWSFSEAGYWTSVYSVEHIRQYGFTVSLPDSPRSTPQHDGYGISMAKLDGSAAFHPAAAQYVPPFEAPWEYGSSWAPHWDNNKWMPHKGVHFTNR